MPKRLGTAGLLLFRAQEPCFLIAYERVEAVVKVETQGVTP